MAIDVRDGDGRLRVRWDDTTRVRTEWDKDGTQTDQRPYTADENTAADQRAGADQAAANLETIGGRMVTVDMPAIAAILEQTNANIRTDPSQEIKELARACRRLQRHVLQLLDGTE